MMGRLTVHRFKSIREVELKLKRVNIVLGPPESGKSNLLEALAPFTLLGQLRSYEKSGVVQRYESGDEVSLSDLKPILTKLTRLRRKEDPFFMFSVDEPAVVRLEINGSLEAKFTYSPEVPSISYGPPSDGELIEVFQLKGYDGITSITASKYALFRIDELEGNQVYRSLKAKGLITDHGKSLRVVSLTKEVVRMALAFKEEGKPLLGIRSYN